MATRSGHVIKRFLANNWNPDGVNECFYCVQPISRKERTVDHLTPLTRGGTNDLSNLCLCCRTCNNAKSDMTLEEFVVFVSRNGGIRRTKELFGKGSQSRKILARGILS